MANPLTGEVRVLIDGHPHTAKLTLGALAELESDLGTASLVDLVARFENGSFSASDVLSLLVAGLRGGGWTGERADLLSARIEDGPLGAARAAARLLACAFDAP